MLAFITSLRHPRNSADYAGVEQLLMDSLRSVLRQEHDAFSVWVVGNRRPERLPDPVNWVGVDFPPPSDVRGPITGRDAVLLDKGTKLAVGLLAARATAPDHVMLFDADDMVSNRLASLSAADPGADGWRIVDGWRWSNERRAIRRQAEFHRHCGTAFIVRPELYSLPEGVGPDAGQDELRDAFGERLFRHIGSHRHLSQDLAAAGRPLEPIGFPAALYRVGTGENHSGVSLGGFGRPIGRGVAAEFGVPPTRLTPAGLARSVLPGRRALERVRVLRPILTRLPGSRGPAPRT
ncbi:glycosyltransferase family 2 protein [Agromyces kandeliae]|uniref:Glycosyltransferase family 2 protein n=1 Tax=Agromyces kandeliae TaxID=2666141 RepID=A0A6L5R3P8_9MICO|nr:glycosyltransferase family 2 protein [Agromyces kandeliae]MRX43687.1 glycosyltransferase family 2 protein [Agromyces kandeliae]